MKGAERMEERYIYGIIKGAEEKTFSMNGESGSNAAYTVPFEGIAAVVSNTPYVDMTALTKDEVAEHLVKHQKVIEKVMETDDIVPLKFGTYAHSKDEMEGILTSGHHKFLEILDDAGSRIELDVVAAWPDMTPVIQGIGEEREVKEFKEKIASKPEGVTFEDQLKIGVLIKKLIDQKKDKLAGEIEDALKSLSISSKRHEVMDDKMIINAAFFMEKEKQPEFEEMLDKVNDRYEESINFRCVGPLPPYSFYTLEVTRLHFEEIRAAKELLGVESDNITLEDLEDAFRKAVLSYHPDKSQSIPDAEGAFMKINDAYKLLEEYCLNITGNGKNGGSSLREDDFRRNAFIVQVRG